MTAAERWRGGWGDLGIQRAGTAPKPDLLAVGLPKARWGNRMADLLKKPEVSAPSPQKFFQTPKMPGPPEP